MTRVKFYVSKGHVTAVRAAGHAEFAEEGEDIVCAGVSSILQTALLGLLKVAGIQVGYRTDEENGELEIVVPKGLSELQQRDSDVILKTALEGISDFADGYSDYINLEVI